LVEDQEATPIEVAVTKVHHPKVLILKKLVKIIATKGSRREIIEVAIIKE